VKYVFGVIAATMYSARVLSIVSQLWNLRYPNLLVASKLSESIPKVDIASQTQAWAVLAVDGFRTEPMPHSTDP
jgi:hypothetical protein